MPRVAGVEEAYGVELYEGSPVKVRRVARGGVAAKAGVRIGDTIEAVDGIDVRAASVDFVYALLQV